MFGEDKFNSFLPLSSNDEAQNFLLPRQMACIKDHTEFILGKKESDIWHQQGLQTELLATLVPGL